MTRVRSGTLLALGAGAMLAACGGDSGGPGALVMTIVGGNNQTAAQGEALALPFSVRIAEDGDPVAGVAVTWTVVQGDGSIAATTTTDADGVASATYTAGDAPGEHRVQAAASGASGSPATFTVTVTALTGLAIAGGNNQSAPAGSQLPAPLAVRALDENGTPIAGATVEWAVTAGGGQLSAATSQTDAQGNASVTYTLGPSAGVNTVTASVDGLPNSPVTFTLTGTASLVPVGGGNNVTERYSSDLWVHGGYAYTGTWGVRGTNRGDAVKVWQLGADGAPTLVNEVVTAGMVTVSDVEVSPDGSLLVFTSDNGTDMGLYVYGLADPANPTFLSYRPVSSGLHTGTLAVINGKLYAFTARNPGGSALLVFDLSDPAAPALADSVPIPQNYGIHDTFVRDGLAFVFAWNSGVRIYDVGNGRAGGSPTNAVLVSQLVTSSNGVSGGPQVHNGWWFHNPNTGEKRYLFVGQEGPAVIGSSSSGDIHVVDVSDITKPVEVASYRLAGAGAHNFWMDEANEILYAAFYNGGVVALDVSGTLAGDLKNREIARVQPGGGGNTYTWGVQLYNGFLYAIDMLSGFWQLEPRGF